MEWWEITIAVVVVVGVVSVIGVVAITRRRWLLTRWRQMEEQNLRAFGLIEQSLHAIVSDVSQLKLKSYGERVENLLIDKHGRLPPIQGRHWEEKAECFYVEYLHPESGKPVMAKYKVLFDGGPMRLIWWKSGTEVWVLAEEQHNGSTKEEETQTKDS